MYLLPETSFIPPFSGYAALTPLVILLLAVFWGLFANYLPGKDRGASIAGLVAALLAAVASAFVTPGTELFGGRFLYTLDVRFAAVVVCILVALWCLWTLGSGVGRTREAISLVMLSSIGAIIAMAATDLIVLILALELTAMPGYVLIGYRRYRIRGLEAALKYFLLSALSTLVMIYGMSFLVGLAGSTTFEGITQMPSEPLTLVAFGLVFFGLLAKLSAAPFHWWSPDACEGSESWAIAYASVIPKIVVVLVIARLVFIAAASVPLIHLIILMVAIMSLIVGAFAALTQRDIRRMIAYSGVACAGYILVALFVVSMGGEHAQAAFYAAIFYVVAYAISAMGVLLISAHEGSKVADLSGLAQRNPFAAFSLTIFALSLIGLPPLAGFFAKLNLFLAVIAAGQIEVVVLAVLMAVVSAFYYLRLIRAAFFGEEKIEEESTDVDRIKKSPYSVCGNVVIATLVVMVILLGILYQPIMNLLVG